MNESDKLFTDIKALLVELFEVDAKQVTWDAQLYQDLELDSIDAVDLIVHLQEQTGEKIAPETFKAVRTVGDVVEAVAGLLKK